MAVGYGATGVDGFLESNSWTGGPGTLLVSKEGPGGAKPALFAHFGTGTKGASGLFSFKVIGATWNAQKKSVVGKDGGFQPVEVLRNTFATKARCVAQLRLYGLDSHCRSVLRDTVTGGIWAAPS